MNPATKSLALFSMTTAMGHFLANSTGSDALKWRGQKLYEAGFTAAKKYKTTKIGKSRLRQVDRKIDEAFPSDESLNILENLSFLLMGMVDLSGHSKNKSRTNIDLVYKRLVWCIRLLDPKREDHKIHDRAWKKFTKWDK